MQHDEGGERRGLRAYCLLVSAKQQLLGHDAHRCCPAILCISSMAEAKHHLRENRKRIGIGSPRALSAWESTADGGFLSTQLLLTGLKLQLTSIHYEVRRARSTKPELAGARARIQTMPGQSG